MLFKSLGAGAALIAATLAAGTARSETSKPAATPPPDHATAKAALIKGFREAHKCQEPLKIGRQFAPLRAKSAIFGSGQGIATQAQLRDKSKPTQRHAELLAEWRGINQKCRDQWLANVAVIPNMEAAERATYAKIDIALGALERREIA